MSLTGGLGRGKLTGCGSCLLWVPVQVRKPIGQCWVDLSRWHLWQSLWQKPVKCLVIGSSRIFWGRWLKVEITKALISLPLFQQELTLSESKLALYEKVPCPLVTYFYHLPLVFKEWFLLLFPFTFLFCSWNLLCFLREDKSSWKWVISPLPHPSFSGIKHGGGESEALGVNCCHRNLMVTIPLMIIKTIQIGIVMACKRTHTHTPTNTCYP